MQSRIIAPPAYNNIEEKIAQYPSLDNLDETLANLGLSDHRTQVVFVLDISSSMDAGTVKNHPTHLISEGHMDSVIRQIARLARVFDNDGQMQIYSFGKNVNPAVITLDVRSDESIRSFSVQNDIIDTLLDKNIRSDTNYAPVLNSIIADFYPENAKHPRKKIKNYNDGVFVFWVTDGACNDRSASLESFIRASYCGGLFIKIIGLGDADFSFLQKLDDLMVNKSGCCFFSHNNARLIDNVDFKDFSVNVLKKDCISNELILDEYIPFLLESIKRQLISKDRGLTGNATEIKHFNIQGRMS